MTTLDKIAAVGYEVRSKALCAGLPARMGASHVPWEELSEQTRDLERRATIAQLEVLKATPLIADNLEFVGMSPRVAGGDAMRAWRYLPSMINDVLAELDEGEGT